MQYIVDRLHIKGHIGEECKRRNHPNNFPDLDGVVTIICEVINSWASSFKHNTKHMNAIHFNFFLFIIFNEFNKIKSEGRIKLCEPYKTLNNNNKRQFENN